MEFGENIQQESVLGDNRLTYFERILLIDIVSLCKKNGYCWPTNRYFMKKFDCTKTTVSKSISSLSKNGYIDIEINNSETNNSKRIIKLSEVLKKRITSIQRNANTSIQNNFNHYNKYNKNKRDILDKIYYVDEFGIEYWHGEPIESKEATYLGLKNYGRSCSRIFRNFYTVDLRNLLNY